MVGRQTTRQLASIDDHRLEEGAARTSRRRPSSGRSRPRAASTPRLSLVPSGVPARPGSGARPGGNAVRIREEFVTVVDDDQLTSRIGLVLVAGEGDGQGVACPAWLG